MIETFAGAGFVAAAVPAAVVVAAPGVAVPPQAAAIRLVMSTSAGKRDRICPPPICSLHGHGVVDRVRTPLDEVVLESHDECFRDDRDDREDDHRGVDAVRVERPL